MKSLIKKLIFGSLIMLSFPGFSQKCDQIQASRTEIRESERIKLSFDSVEKSFTSKGIKESHGKFNTIENISGITRVETLQEKNKRILKSATQVAVICFAGNPEDTELDNYSSMPKINFDNTFSQIIIGDIFIEDTNVKEFELLVAVDLSDINSFFSIFNKEGNYFIGMIAKAPYGEYKLECFKTINVTNRWGFLFDEYRMKKVVVVENGF